MINLAAQIVLSRIFNLSLWGTVCQQAFVSHDLADTADAEIEQIRKIHETAFAEVGWREIHVRSRLESPVVGNLTLAELAALLKIPAESSGVTYHGVQFQISDGYSFKSDDGLTVYGVTPNGNVQVVGLPPFGDSRPTPESINQLKTLARELNLDLVNWCRCIRVGPDIPSSNRCLRMTNDE